MSIPRPSFNGGSTRHVVLCPPLLLPVPPVVSTVSIPRQFISPCNEPGHARLCRDPAHASIPRRLLGAYINAAPPGSPDNDWRVADWEWDDDDTVLVTIPDEVVAEIRASVHVPPPPPPEIIERPLTYRAWMTTTAKTCFQIHGTGLTIFKNNDIIRDLFISAERIPRTGFSGAKIGSMVLLPADIDISGEHVEEINVYGP